MRGLRKFGQMFMLFGYGNSQYAASHGRPVWNTGKTAAHMTAKIVIASAKRLIDMRHFCRKSSRIAEMSVPAWPIPIHQTKLTIAKPQPTGMLTPQMPVPLMSEPGDREQEHRHHAERDHEADEPAGPEAGPQYRRCDLVGHRAERVARREDVGLQPRHAGRGRGGVRIQSGVDDQP